MIRHLYILCSPPQVKSPPITIYNPLTLYYPPPCPVPSGHHLTVVCVCEVFGFFPTTCLNIYDQGIFFPFLSEHMLEISCALDFVLIDSRIIKGVTRVLSQRKVK